MAVTLGLPTVVLYTKYVTKRNFYNIMPYTSIYLYYKMGKVPIEIKALCHFFIIKGKVTDLNAHPFSHSDASARKRTSWQPCSR